MRIVEMGRGWPGTHREKPQGGVYDQENGGID